MLCRAEFFIAFMCLSLAVFSGPAFPQSTTENPIQEVQSPASLREVIALLEDDKAEAEEERKRVAAALGAAQAELGKISGELEGKREERRTNLLLIAEIELTRRELETEFTEAKAAVAQEQRALEALRTETSTTQGEAEELLIEIEGSTGRLESLRAEIAIAEQDAAQTNAIRAEKAKIEASMAAIDQLRSEAESALDGVHAQLAGLESDIAATTAFAAEQEKAKELSDTEIMAEENKLLELKGAVADAEAVKIQTESMRAEMADMISRRDAAQEKLAATSTELSTVSDVMAVQTEARGDLEQSVAAARATLEGLDAEISDKQAKSTSIEDVGLELGQLRDTLSVLEDSKMAAEAELDQTRAELELSRNEAQALNAGATEITKKAVQAESAVTAAEEPLASLLSESQAMRDDMKTLAESRAELQAVSSDRALIDSQHKTASSELALVETALQESRQASDVAAVKLDKQRAELATTEERFAAAEAALVVTTSAEEAARKAAADFDEVARNRDVVLVELDDLKNKLAETRAAFDGAETNLEDQQNAAAIALTKIDETSSRLSTLAKQKTEKNGEIKGLVADIRSRRGVLADLDDEITQARSDSEEERAGLEADRVALRTELATHEARLSEGTDAVERLAVLAGKEATLLVTLSDLAQRRDASVAEIETLEAVATKAEDTRKDWFAESDLLAASLAEKRKLLTATENKLIDIEQAKVTRLGDLGALDAEFEAMRANAEQARSDFEKLTRLLTDIGSDVEAPDTLVSVTTEEVAPIAAAALIAAPVDAKPLAEPVGVRNFELSMSRQEIRAVIVTAPGLDDAGPADLARLTTELERGTCPVDALNAVFGRVNRQTLVALIRGIGSC